MRGRFVLFSFRRLLHCSDEIEAHHIPNREDDESKATMSHALLCQLLWRYLDFQSILSCLRLNKSFWEGLNGKERWWRDMYGERFGFACRIDPKDTWRQAFLLRNVLMRDVVLNDNGSVCVQAVEIWIL